MDADPLRRAKEYPYFIPAGSFVLTGGGTMELSPGAPLPDVSGRHAVLACGSNQSPDRLRQKFPRLGGVGIPVFRARLADFDVVYSAHIAAYGSVPATLQYAPGTTVTLSITWLTEAELDRMHETETASGNYVFGVLDGLRLDLGGGRVLNRVSAYISTRGCLVLDGAPVALAAIPAIGRKWPSQSQKEVLSGVRDRLTPGRALNDFLREAINDDAVRQLHADVLVSDSHSFAYEKFAPMPI